jgi:uncharacterized membrane protein
VGKAILIVTFNDMEKADKAYKTLEQWQKENLIEVGDAVVLVKDEKGKVKVHETHEFTSKKGAVWGGAAGAVVGLMVGGPIGGLVLGAAAGGLLAKGIDMGVSNEEIEAVEESMNDASSAIALQIISIHDKSMLKAMVRELEGTVFELTIDEAADLALDKGMEGFVER